MTDFTPIKDANLRPHDLAKLVGVGRVTASGWLNGRHQPHPILNERVQRVIDLVKASVDEGAAGDLPVPATVPARERWAYVDAAIRKVSHFS